MKGEALATFKASRSLLEASNCVDLMMCHGGGGPEPRDRLREIRGAPATQSSPTMCGCVPAAAEPPDRSGASSAQQDQERHVPSESRWRAYSIVASLIAASSHAGRNWLRSFLVPQWRQSSRNGPISGTLEDPRADLQMHHDRQRCTGGV